MQSGDFTSPSNPSVQAYSVGAAYEGSQYGLMVLSTVHVQQTVATTPGVTYQLCFAWASSNSWPYGVIQVTIGGVAQPNLWPVTWATPWTIQTYQVRLWDQAFVYAHAVAVHCHCQHHHDFFLQQFPIWILWARCRQLRAAGLILTARTGRTAVTLLGCPSCSSVSSSGHPLPKPLPPQPRLPCPLPNSRPFFFLLIKACLV